MDHTIASAILRFVSDDPPPSITDLLSRDAPKYNWTTALVETLVGQALSIREDHATGEIKIISTDGTSVLRIATDASGIRAADGLMAEELKALISAIRIHEVESYDLVMLPPDMRKADLDYLCGKMGITTDKLRRLTDLWISQK